MLSGLPGSRSVVSRTAVRPRRARDRTPPAFPRGLCGLAPGLVVVAVLGLGTMDPFLTLLHSFSLRLSDSEVSSLKFLCTSKIGKRKLELVQTAMELFRILIEQQDITRENVTFLEELLESIKRCDLLSELTKFVEEGKVTAPDEQPDEHEKRLQKAAIEVISNNVGRDWKMLMRKLDLSEVQMDRIVDAHPRNLREQLVQSLRVWQTGKGKDAKVADLVKALRSCDMNLVADKVERELLVLSNGTK